MFIAKYIIYREFRTGNDVADVFSPKIQHVDRHMTHCEEGNQPIAAGICMVFNGRVTCEGNSETLQLAGRGTKDAQIIQQLE